MIGAFQGSAFQQTGFQCGSAVIQAAGIASAEAIGRPDVVAIVLAIGIPTAEAVGAPIISGVVVGHVIDCAGIPSGEILGLPDVVAIIEAAGIPSSEAVGNPIIGEVVPPVIIGGGGVGVAGGSGGYTVRRDRKYRVEVLKPIEVTDDQDEIEEMVEMFLMWKKAA